MITSSRKIVAGLLSTAMVLTSVVGLTASVFADTTTTTTTTTSSNFSRSLTVGSRGSDVTALQTILASKGYLMVSPTGYFGSLTRRALAAWQAAAGISPAVGYFGPITRAYLATNGSLTVVTTSTPGCPAGAMFNYMTGAACASTPVVTTGGTWTPDGTDGSITLSYVSYAPASQTLKKGDTNKPLISVKLQAVNGKTAVTRMDVHFSERPWLDFGSLNLTDASGNILATKTLTGASDVTEVTVGSDYLVRFDNISPIVVTPGNDMIVAVAGNVLAASDKITGQSVYVAIPAGSIRTINGKNYTDSIGLSSGQGSAPVNGTGNVVVLSSTGSKGAIYTRIDPTSPATKTTVVTSANQVKTGVTLGVFGLKSQNQNSTINGLAFNLNDNTNVAPGTIYSNVRLSVNGQTYGSNAITVVGSNPPGTATTTTFSNLSIPLSQDAWVPVTLLADVQSGVTGVSASSTLVASGIVGVDSNYNTVDVTNAGNQTSTDNVYTTSGISVTAPTASIGSCTGATNTTSNNKCTVTMSFTVTNVGNNDIFISKTPSIALATSSTPATASTTLQSINLAAGAGDTTQAYDVTSGGSRTFTYQGTFSQIAGGGFESFKIAAIKFGVIGTDGSADNGSQNLTVSSDTASLINFGLEPLFVSQTL